MAEYRVQFDIFEGPLDLLLFLVRKQEVDVYQINLTRLAVDFLRYLEQMQELDLEIAGEFLVMAATLLHIKSRELLPKEKQAETSEEDEEEDPRWELIRQLVEYKKFKDAASNLQTREDEQADIYRRLPGKPDLPPLEPLEQKTPVSVFDLLTAVNAILARVQRDEAGTSDIHADRFTVSEKIQVIRQRILQRKRVRFAELFTDAHSRPEVVCTFLAMLELIRLHIVEAVQDRPFGDIELQSHPLESENSGRLANLESEMDYS